MVIFGRIVILVVLTLAVIPCYACKCGMVSLQYESNRAYDFIVGTIYEEKENFQEYRYSTPEGEIYDWGTSYSYFINVEYSFEDKVGGQIEFFGGKGWGDCGGIFEKGKTYLIVLYKGDKGYFTKLCSNHSPIVQASWQVAYLNHAFCKNYQVITFNCAALCSILLILPIFSSALLVFRYYKHRSRRRKRKPAYFRNLTPPYVLHP
jgi:hypothetical protein